MNFIAKINFYELTFVQDSNCTACRVSNDQAFSESVMVQVSLESSSFVQEPQLGTE